jgi:hypothetical protein
MNCQKFENVVSELARSQMIEADIRKFALAHTEECVTCRQRLRQEEMLTQGLRALAMEVQSVQAPAEIERRLRGAFRARPSSEPAAVGKGYGRYWLVAVAAMLLVVFSVLAVRWRGLAPVTPKPEVIANGADPKKISPESLPPAKEMPDKAQVVGHSGKRLRRNYRLRPPDSSIRNSEVAINNTPREITTEFMPLGYLNPANLQDGGQIVRVELPRSALATFGLPVNMERYNEKVKADVLLGVDGLAHAIRFVQ